MNNLTSVVHRERVVETLRIFLPLILEASLRKHKFDVMVQAIFAIVGVLGNVATCFILNKQSMRNHFNLLLVSEMVSMGSSGQSIGTELYNLSFISVW